MKDCQHYQIAMNHVVGPIPPELGNLGGSLSNLRLFENQLTGCIPAELGRLENLVYLCLEINHLSGPIPMETFGKLTKLEELRLFWNQFTASDVEWDALQRMLPQCSIRP